MSSHRPAKPLFSRTVVRTLEEVRRALVSELEGEGPRLAFLNTRLILATGTSLTDTRDDENLDVDCVRRVLEELQAMGFLSFTGIAE